MDGPAGDFLDRTTTDPQEWSGATASGFVCFFWSYGEDLVNMVVKESQGSNEIREGVSILQNNYPPTFDNCANLMG